MFFRKQADGASINTKAIFPMLYFDHLQVSFFINAILFFTLLEVANCFNDRSEIFQS
jgi:hypothetical protein